MIRKLIFTILLLVSSVAVAQEAAPYTEEANQKLVRATKSIEAPDLASGTGQERLVRYVAYFTEVYKKAGFSFSKSLSRWCEYSLKNNDVPDLRPAARNMMDIVGGMVGLATPDMNYNLVLPGKDFDTARAYFKNLGKQSATSAPPVVAQSPQEVRKAIRVDNSEKSGPCAGLDMTIRAEYETCVERRTKLGLNPNPYYKGDAAATVSQQVAPASPATTEQSGICKGLDLVVTSDQTECLSRKYAEADKKLNVVYKDVFAKLDTVQKRSLRDSQRAWIKEKETKCDALAKEGGSMAAVESESCKVQMTEQRTQFVQSYKP